MTTIALSIDGRSLRDWLSDPLLQRVALLAELDAFLHDIDKASEDFILATSEHKGEQYPSLELAVACRNSLRNQAITEEMRKQFAEKNLVLANDLQVIIKNSDNEWELHDSQGNCHYKLKLQHGKIEVRQSFCRCCSLCPQPFNQDYSHAKEYDDRSPKNQQRIFAIKGKDFTEEIRHCIIPISELKLANIHLAPDSDNYLSEEITNCVEIDSYLGETARYHHLETGKKKHTFLDKIEKLKKLSWLTWLISSRYTACDGLDSRYDKACSKKQNCDQNYLASAFGYEFSQFDSDRLQKLEASRQEFLQQIVTNIEQEWTLPGLDKMRAEILHLAGRDQWDNFMSGYFRIALGETRRSANDVLLFDHAFSVAAMLKSMLVRVVLEAKLFPDKKYYLPLDCRENQPEHIARPSWNLYSVALNTQKFLYQSTRIGELRGFYQKWSEVCDQLRYTLEIEFPVATELYRDLDGIHFLIPQFYLPGETDSNCRLNQELRVLLDEQVRKIVDESGYFCQETKVIGKENQHNLLALAKGVSWSKQRHIPLHSHYLPEWINQDSSGTTGQDICNCCKQRLKQQHCLDYCQDCYELRQGRANDWYKQRHTTIWTDELQDDNSQLALISAKFDLTCWLDGAEVESLLADVGQKLAAKYPSMARIRRLWSSTQIFFNEVSTHLQESYDWKRDVGKLRFLRLRLRAKLMTDAKDQLGKQNQVEYQIAKRILPFYVRRINDGEFYEFTSITNLAVQEKFEEILDELKEKLTQEETFPVTIEHDSGNDQQHSECRFRLEPGSLDFDEVEYQPFIDIVATPQLFQFLCPADQADSIVRFIYGKYQREMSKVRDRLPLHINVCAFKNKTPLYVVLQTARNMLSPSYLRRNLPKKKRKEEWTVAADPQAIDIEYASKHGQRQTRKSQGLELSLQAPSGFSYAWQIDTMTGDPEVTDLFYPNFAVNPEQHRERDNITLIAPESDQRGDRDTYLNVRELRQGDTVYVQPSTFDFVLIRSSTDRFLTADEKLIRSSTDHFLTADEKRRRVCYLDDLQTFDSIWQILNYEKAEKCQYSQNQLQKLQSLLLEKRAAWEEYWKQRNDGEHDQVVDHFLDSVLKHPHQFQDYFRRPGKEKEYCLLKHACYTGLFFDVVDYYCNIGNRKINGTDNQATEAK